MVSRRIIAPVLVIVGSAIFTTVWLLGIGLIAVGLSVFLLAADGPPAPVRIFFQSIPILAFLPVLPAIFAGRLIEPADKRRALAYSGLAVVTILMILAILVIPGIVSVLN